MSNSFKKTVVATAVGTIMAIVGPAASAASFQSMLEYSAVGAFGGNLTSNTPPYFGKVSLTEGGSGTGAYVDVSVTLSSGFRFIDTGNTGEHTSFVFNVSTPSTISVTNINPSPPWYLNVINPTDNSPFGTFTTGLDCCVKNGAPGILGPLSFRVSSTTGITFGGSGNHFMSNSSGSIPGSATGGWLFAADLVGPDGSSTGMVAARDLVPTTPIPEPETYAMLLAGLGLMGFVARRRQRNLAVA